MRIFFALKIIYKDKIKGKYMKIKTITAVLLLFSCGYYKQYKRKDGEKYCKKTSRDLIPVGLLLCQDAVNRAGTQDERNTILNRCNLIPLAPEMNCN